MFIFKKHISRRTVLKGAGVTLALPFLEAMVPAATALAQTAANPKIRARLLLHSSRRCSASTPSWGRGRSVDTERKGRGLQAEQDHGAAGALQEICVDDRESREQPTARACTRGIRARG